MQQLVCEVCGRATASGSEDFGDWLLGLPRSTGKQTIRCPAHITEWSLRQAQYPRTKQIRQWVKEAKERDASRVVPVNPYMSPYSLEIEEE